MNRVDQRLIDPVRGDCMRACLATITGLPYEMVPDLAGEDADGGNWYRTYSRWCKTHGLNLQGTFSRGGKWLNAAHWAELSELSAGINGLFMAAGPSPRPGVRGGHAIVVDSDGHMVHDPHPSRAGVQKVEGLAGIMNITSVQMIELDHVGHLYHPKIKWGGYTEGVDRNDQHLVSHLYAWLTDSMSPVAPMCARGWNRSDGSGFSIFRGNTSEAGTCQVCLRRAAAHLPPVLSRPRKTRWI
jgi:hypothetical protein